MSDKQKVVALKHWNRLTNATHSERVLLGGLLLDSGFFDQFDKKICCADFVHPLHQNIFDTMWRVFQKRRCFDVPMIADEMQDNSSYLYELANECPSTANLNAHCDIIREKSVQRQLAECAAQIREAQLEEEHFKPLEGSPLGKFFIELGHEVNATQLDVDYLRSLMIEVNKAVVHTLTCIEDSEEEVA